MNINQFKNYFEKYFKNISIDKDYIDNLLDTWNTYKNKIDTGTLTLLEYNSVKNNFSSENEYSLRHFIERESDYLGGFGMMISNKVGLWVKGTSDNKQYYRCSTKANDNSTEISESDAQNFLKEILNQLKELFQQNTIDSVLSYIEKTKLTDYIVQNFLYKMIVFNSWTNDKIDYKNKLIFIYNFKKHDSLEIIDNKGKNALDFLNDTKLDILKKNEKLTATIADILGIKNPSTEDLFRIGSCYWDLTGTTNNNEILNYKNIILYGPPGTGKTYSVTKTLEGTDNDCIKYVQFHAGFTYEDFIEGIKPNGIDRSGNLKFEIVNGVFKEFCIEALGNPNKEYYFIADEINRANLSSVFGETLSLLEEDYRYKFDDENHNKSLRSTPLSNVIKKMYLDAKGSNIQEEIDKVDKLIFYRNVNTNDILFGIPENVHFIGMMNDVDKSIDTFDLALRRRFVWVKTHFDEKPIVQYLLGNRVTDPNIDKYINNINELNYYITGNEYKNVNKKEINSLNMGSNFELGHAIFMKIKVINKKIIKASYEDLWNMHIEPTLREYLRTSLSDSELDNKLKEAKKLFVNN